MDAKCWNDITVNLLTINHQMMRFKWRDSNDEHFKWWGVIFVNYDFFTCTKLCCFNLSDNVWMMRVIKDLTWSCWTTWRAGLCCSCWIWCLGSRSWGWRSLGNANRRTSAWLYGDASGSRSWCTQGLRWHNRQYGSLYQLYHIFTDTSTWCTG